MDHFVIWIKQVTAWLYIPIYQNQLFFIDYWSFVHFWSGFVLFALLIVLNFRPSWLWLFICLTAYEIFEVALLYFSLNIFLPETIKDQFTDIFVGLIGGGLCYLFLVAKKKMRTEQYRRISPEAILTSLTFAFLLIGNAQFFLANPYSNGIFSDPRFILFSIGGYVFLQTYSRMRKSERYRYKGILIYASVSLVIFLTISSFQYQQFEESLLKLDTIILLLSLVMIYPFLSILFYKIALMVFGRSAEKLQLRIIDTKE
jgi:hypothetical protein